MKIIFMGTPSIAARILEFLISEGLNIDGVITQPDKKSGRNKEVLFSPVKLLAQKKCIPLFQPENKNELTEIIKIERPDLCIVAAYGIIIPQEALDIPKFGIINFHPSILPKYRGPSPIITAILNGDKETGVSIIAMNEKMDEGDIIAQTKTSLSGSENNVELEAKLSDIGSKLLLDVINNIPEVLQKKVKQKGVASYTKIFKKIDGEIDWQNMTATEIEKMSRAYDPWPGVYSYWNGKKIDFYGIEINSKKVIRSGTVLIENGKIYIGTKDRSISPAFVKLEGKNDSK